MKVVVKTPECRDVISKRILSDPGVYFVLVDGHLAGTIGYRPKLGGICFHKRFSPLDKAEIERQVTEQLGQLGKPSSTAPEPRKETRAKVADDFSD